MREETENHWFNPYVCKNRFEWKAWSRSPARWSPLSFSALTRTCGLILKGVNNGCLTQIPHLVGEWKWEKMLNGMKTDIWHGHWPLAVMSPHTQILDSFVVEHATLSGMYLWVEEWARVEELWDLEDCRLPGKGASAPCLMTLSVAGTFLEIYCKWERKKSPFVTDRRYYITTNFIYYEEWRTSTMGISSGPGPGWLGPLARFRLGWST